MLNINREVIDKLIKSPLIQNIASLTLLYANLHKRNIYVSDEDLTLVIGLINWQFISVKPAFIYANETPDFAAYPDYVPLSDDGREKPAGKKEIVEDKKYKDALLYSRTFNICIKGFVPKLRATKALDDTLLKPFRYCYSS